MHVDEFNNGNGYFWARDELRLDGVITNFLSYMAASTDKHAERYIAFDDMVLVVFDGDSETVYSQCTDLKVRKAFISCVMQSAKHRFEKIKGSNFNTQTLYVYPYQEVTLELIMELVHTIAKGFAKENDRIVALAWHLSQRVEGSTGLTQPHVHVFYSRKPRKVCENEFLTYFYEALGKIG